MFGSTDSDSDSDQVLSFSDLPREFEFENTSQRENQAPQDQDLFEFFNTFNTEMCAAEDIFLRGKILPYKPPKQEFENRKSFRHLRSESLNYFQTPRSSIAQEKFHRPSFSVDYKKLDRVSSSKTPNQNRNSIGSCFGGTDFPVRRIDSSKRKWQNLFTFGLVKPRVEMEMKDIRNRQRRRNPSTFYPAFDGGETVSVSRDEGNKKSYSWKLIRALSCSSNVERSVVSSLARVRTGGRFGFRTSLF
ncbi:uncharacterized protein LOC143849547 [Tasmannia lanceolata]|uniref:uncharacterized protein LOC143849547 n=1 Tax=Tasmannia lanceolata TaxID=3420 RepID=UPI00406478CB